MDSATISISGLNAYSIQRSLLMWVIALCWLFSLSGLAFCDTTSSLLKGSRTQQLTKPQAQAYISQQLEPSFKDMTDPMQREIMTCLVGGAIDVIYRGNTSFDVATLEARFGSLMEELKDKDTKPNLILMRCFINSKEVEKAIDKQNQEQHLQTPPLPLIDMDDLRVDMASLDGKRVRVVGFGYYMMDMFMIKKNRTDTSPVFVDITKLPRQQRKEIIGQCVDILAGCRLIVTGTVRNLTYQKGVLAERIDWQ